VIDSFQGLPGGVGISHLRVYDWESPDGVRGGSAHVHLACTESYVVIAGRGRLQTLSGKGFEEIELHERQVVWFTPGVVHRLVVSEADLEIIIVMQNSGLPESGDVILSFPEQYLKDRARYAEAAGLPSLEHGPEAVAERARWRRDLSIEGFVELRAAMERHGHAALEAFYRNAAALVEDRREDWRAVWQHGAVRAAETTGEQLAALQRHELAYLSKGGLHEAQVRPGSPRAGMCGRITDFDTLGARA
jgi:mannose-6-phosphate isomerase-like protein (cupin superfamily)